MRTKALWLFAAALVITSLVVGPAATAKPSRSAAGTVVIGHDQEPATLNNLITPGNAYTTSLVTNLVLASGQRYNQKAILVPQLFQGKPKLVKSNPLTVRFTIKAAAKWSNGSQVTGNDFRATYQAIMNKNWDITSREGWEDIRSMQVRGKTVTVIFRKPYAAWEVLISGNIYPAASLRGANVNTLYQSSLDVSSGPYRFSSWQKGTQLVLVKNATFRAGPQARLDRLVFRYIPNTASLFQSLRSNEIQVTSPAAAPDRGDPAQQLVSGPVRPRVLVRAHGHAAGPAGPSGAEAEVRPPGAHPEHHRADVRNALYVNSGLVASAAQLPVLQSLIWKPFEANTGRSSPGGASMQRAAIARSAPTAAPAVRPRRTATTRTSGPAPASGSCRSASTSTAGNQALRALTFDNRPEPDEGHGHPAPVRVCGVRADPDLAFALIGLSDVHAARRDSTSSITGFRPLRLWR